MPYCLILQILSHRLVILILRSSAAGIPYFYTTQQGQSNRKGHERCIYGEIREKTTHSPPCVHCRMGLANRGHMYCAWSYMCIRMPHSEYFQRSRDYGWRIGFRRRSIQRKRNISAYTITRYIRAAAMKTS